MTMWTTTLALPFLLPAFATAISINCEHIRVDKKSFDLSSIGGPHSVIVQDDSKPPAVYNTTYTVDICKPLRKLKSIPNRDQCDAGTHVCGITRRVDLEEETEPEHVISIAGNYETSSGRALDPQFTRLKTTDVSTDGLRVELHGGKYGKRAQMAVIEFQCDYRRTGNEGSEVEEKKSLQEMASAQYDRRRSSSHASDDKGGDDSEEEETSSLRFVSYGSSGDGTDVLRLNWLTKYACEDAENDDSNNDGKSGKDNSGSHWGLFTWFLIIAFLGIAAYLIFGSWLNYNRYGARGWDLLPHGDTIRDIPYLFKDWSRKVASTVSGGGSRGGYSAV